MKKYLILLSVFLILSLICFLSCSPDLQEERSNPCDPKSPIYSEEIICDGVDNDCNADTLDAPDGDGDTWDVCGSGNLVNPDDKHPADCNDSDANINPGTAEVTCDVVDNDCNAATLDAPDGDGDGWDVCGADDPVNPDGNDPADCDDDNATTYPGAREICGDGMDQDCDESLICDGGVVDSDGDEYASEISGGTDCNDGVATINPGAHDNCGDDLDQNCDKNTTCYAYVADGANGGLAIIDVGVPANPGTPAYRDTSGDSHGVYVTGGYAYVADGNSGLAIIDVSDPTDPGTPVYQDTSGSSRGVYVTGGYAYVANTDSGLAIIDVSEPANPGTPVYRDTSWYSWGVYVNGGYAYVADRESGLAIIDVTDPANPGTPVYRNTSGNSWGVHVTGGYAYVADGNSGLAIINVSEPANPGTPVYQDTSGNSYGVYVTGEYAYVGDRNYGLAIINVSEPANPGTPVYMGTSDSSWGVYVTGGYAYVANGNSGLAIINVTDPENPGTPVYRDTTGSSIGVYVTQ
jgi:hypothetical protein